MSDTKLYIDSHNDVGALIDFVKGKKVIIYGAGKIGAKVIQSLREFDIEPLFYWDKNASTLRKAAGLEVKLPDPESLENKDEYVVIVTIYAEAVSAQIGRMLSENGFKNIVYKRQDLNSIIYSRCVAKKSKNEFKFDRFTCHICPVSKDNDLPCDIYNKAILENVVKHKNTHEEKPFIMPSMGILVTNFCNLTCVGCNHLRDLYKPSDNKIIPTEVILHDLSKVVDAVDMIEKVVIVGGESFFHKDILNIVKGIMTMPKIGLVQIITNGTMLPKTDEIFEILHSDRVMVEVSAYEGEINSKLQGNVETFISKLEKYNVNYQYQKTLEWFDFGGFEHRNFTKKEHRKVYKTCCFISNDMFDGKIFKCSRSVFGTKLGKIPDYKQDYVDVREFSGRELREKINEFLNFEFPEVCQHCNGTSELRIPAGVQVEGSPSAPKRQVSVHQE